MPLIFEIMFQTIVSHFHLLYYSIRSNYDILLSIAKALLEVKTKILHMYTGSIL